MAATGAGTGAGRHHRRSVSGPSGAPGAPKKTESVTVFLRLRPEPEGAASLFEVGADRASATLHPPIAAGAVAETRINAASPATAMKLTFGLGQTPSKIK